MAQKVKCPNCSATLSLPDDVANCVVRCGACQERFRLGASPAVATAPASTPTARPSPAPVHAGNSLDNAVSDWLNGGDDDDTDRLAPSASKEEMPRTSSNPDDYTPLPKKSSTGERSPRLVGLEQRGVLLEFAAECLHRDQLRSAIPRCCIHCQARMHLSAHLVIFTSQLRDSISMEGEHKAGQLVIPQEQLVGLEGSAMLAKLPEVPNEPPPANLPMPYWVCDMCSGAGEISGQIQVGSDGNGLCRLKFRNARLAEGFMANAGGKDTQDMATLREFLERLEEDRWDALPSAVRHRMEQWFRPEKSEKFLGYVPDRAFVRTEDGMAGLVVSTHRLIYHRPPMHQESRSDSEVVIKSHMAGGVEIVQVEGSDFKRRQMAVDRGGMMMLRKGLAEGHFKATWQ
jgi:hypothetical protein